MTNLTFDMVSSCPPIPSPTPNVTAIKVSVLAKSQKSKKDMKPTNNCFYVEPEKNKDFGINLTISQYLIEYALYSNYKILLIIIILVFTLSLKLFPVSTFYEHRHNLFKSKISCLHLIRINIYI